MQQGLTNLTGIKTFLVAFLFTPGYHLLQTLFLLIPYFTFLMQKKIMKACEPLPRFLLKLIPPFSLRALPPFVTELKLSYLLPKQTNINGVLEQPPNQLK